ncbi:hypothetical protein LBMAG27_15960 [Bacteroidota bacterium]|nr:hypothetical protein LBMAG27_15960 [Bacteroidota bacterium]
MAAATTILVVLKLKKTENRFAEQNEMKNEAAEERQEIAGAANWWNSMRANQNTHTIDIADVLNARREADENLANTTRSLSLTWEDMGPDNVGGRTRAILFDKTNPSHVFAGGVSGGLWESANMGQSWNRISGFTDATIWNNQNISCITQTENGDIYVGTGEYFGFFETSVVGGGTGFPGDGIWKSTDHGASWVHVKTSGSTVPSTSTAWSFVTSLSSGGSLFPNRVYATIKAAGSTNGLVYSDDGGASWSNTGSSGLTSLGSSVAVASNGIVHAIVGNKYFHTDATAVPTTFSSLGVTGLPLSNQIARMAVAVAPSDPNYVYVIASASGQTLQGVYKSTDGGSTFTQIAPAQSGTSVNWSPVTQGSYALAIGVLPSNPNVVFIGGLDCYKYDVQSNGTYAWNKITVWTNSPSNPAYTHADIHTFVFNPSNANMMFIGSDGGLSMTTSASAYQPVFGTRNLGYNVTQFYSCDVFRNSGIFVGGTQDNGNFLVDFTGNTTKTGVAIKGGDGGDVQVSQSDSFPHVIFAEYVNGSIERSIVGNNNSTSFSGFFDTHIDAGPSGTPDGEPDDGAAFIAPMLLYENLNADTAINFYSKFFLGTYNGVWMTQQAINFSGAIKWYKVSKTNISGVVISLAITPDGKSLFAGTEGGNLYRIDGLDTTYAYHANNIFYPDSVGITTTLIHNFSGRFVTGISVDKSNATHVVVTLGNYGNTDYIYESNDAITGATFTNITGNLPKMPMYCSAIDPTDPNTIIIGTELGIWATENGGTTWSEQNNTMARVPVTKLRQVPVGNYLNAVYASTYGNGVWRTFSNSAVSIQDIKTNSDSEMKVFPNPASDEINFISQSLWGNNTVRANLISTNGRLIKSIDYGKMPFGIFTLKINLSDVATGNYLLQVISGSNQSVSKVSVIH